MRLAFQRENYISVKCLQYLIYSVALIPFLSSFAVDQVIRKNIITTDPIRLAIGVINVKYEIMENKTNCGGIGCAIWNYEGDTLKWYAYGINGSYTTFFDTQNSPAGWWGSAGVGIIALLAEYIPTGERANLFGYIPSFSAGHSWLFGPEKNFIFSLGGSISYIIARVDLVGREKIPFGGLSLSYICKIGILW